MAHPKPFRVVTPRPSIHSTAKKLRVSKTDLRKVVLLNKIISEGRRPQAHGTLSKSAVRKITEQLSEQLKTSRRTAGSKRGLAETLGTATAVKAE